MTPAFDDISLFGAAVHVCGSGHETRPGLWLVVDAHARPDLKGTVQEMDDRSVVCSQCGARGVRQIPLVVAKRDPMYPAVLVVQGATPRPAVTAQIDATSASEWPTGGFSVLELPVPIAAIAFGRTFELDVEDPAATEAEVRAEFGRHKARKYRRFLDELADVTFSRARMALVRDAIATETSDEFERLLDAHPELLDERTLAVLDREYVADPSDVRIDLGRRFLRAARTDPSAAWVDHRGRVMTIGESLTAAGDELVERLEAARGDAEETIALVLPALEDPAENGFDDDFVGDLLDALGDAYLKRTEGERVKNVEMAADAYARALELTPAGHATRATRLMNAAVAVGSLVRGDPHANAVRAGAYLDEALELMGADGDPEHVAMTQTNAAQVLMIPGAPLEAVRTAIALCRRALEYRSPKRSVENWSYSMVNLGVALSRLASLGEGGEEDAEAAYTAVIDAPAGVPDAVRAHARLCMLNLRLAQLDRLDDDTDEPQPTALLTEVLSRAQQVADDPSASEVNRGTARRRAGDVLSSFGRTEDARQQWNEALKLLSTSDLDGARAVASSLGMSYADSGDWRQAAANLDVAVALLDDLLDARHAAGDRLALIGESNRITRWASHALVRTGDMRQAVVTLENGRTRELRSQLAIESPEVAELQLVAPRALAAWTSASAELADGLNNLHAAGAVRDAALDDIRGIPGFERFAAGASAEEIAEAAEPGHPVIYVNPTPTETVLIRVGHDEDVSAVALPVTSQQIAFRVMFGVDPDDPTLEDDLDADPSDRPTHWSYVMAAAAPGDEAGAAAEEGYLGSALDHLLPWIGAHVATPLAELLRRHGDSGAVLIVSGPLAGTPIAAAPLGAGRLFIDEFSVVSTPSATAHRYARRRARSSGNAFRHLVAVADPTLDLEGTRQEVNAVKAQFEQASVATGHAATAGWLTEHASEASVLHLACHGFGGMVNGSDSGIELAAGDVMTSAQLANLGPLNARLAVASACQTNVIEIGDLADEAITVGTALLAAGAACSIASLWPVDDLATSLLMARLYEVMASGHTPPSALRRAQLWLRAMTPDEEATYLDRYPPLRALQRTRAAGHRASPPEAGDGDYGHPEYWAAFVALGA